MVPTREYMSRLPTIAQELAVAAMKLEQLGNFTHLEMALFDSWARFENAARVYGYDVLSRVHAKQAIVRLCTQELGMLLYTAPGGDWQRDVAQLEAKDRDYGGSWCKRGGIGAFMMAARKWDRIENETHVWGSLGKCLRADTRPEGIQDDIGDLRRYLLLIEAHNRATQGE